MHKYRKGEEVEAVVLSVDPERERISLGIKQLDKDPFANFVADNPKGSIVKGTVVDVEPKAATVDLGDGIEGVLRATELSRDRVEDARSVLSMGDEVECKFIGLDRKSRTVNLSIKAKDEAEERAVVNDYQRGESGGGTTLGDLLKEQIGAGDDKE